MTKWLKAIGLVALLTAIGVTAGPVTTATGVRSFGSGSSSSSSSGGFTADSGYSLSGTIGHGNALTLTKSGGGFGTGPTTAKILHDFNAAATYSGAGLSEGSTIPVTSSYPFIANTPLDTPNACKYSLLNLRHSHQTANYKFSTRCTLEWPRVLGADSPPNGQDILYGRMWLYRVNTGSVGGSQSNKFMRTWDSLENDGTRVSYGTTNLTVVNNDGLNDTTGHPDIPEVGQWKLYEVYVSTDVEVRGYEDGVAEGAYTGTFKDTGFPSLGMNFKLFGYDTGGTSPMDANFHMGDIYAADSRARVLITTSSTCTSMGTAQEIQTPSGAGWADGSIVFTEMDGQFTSLSGKYLCVIKSDNTALRAGQFDMLVPMLFVFARFRRRRAANDDAIEAWRKVA